MSAPWPTLPFDEAVEDASGGNIKTKQNDYAEAGEFPIVDQGKALIAGYTDDEAALCKAQLPVVIFGDHTRCLKFVDFPFGMGADGVKVLKPKAGLDAKFLYHYLRQIKLPDGGYDRHFKYLKRETVPLPPLEEQRRIAAILDQAETLRTQRRTALALLDSLTQSLFLDMFGDAETNKMGFQISTLGSAIKLKSGNFLPASQMADKGQFPVYGGNGINGKHDEFMFEEPKIVIGRVGAYCGCVHVTEPRSWVTDNALYIEAFDSALHPEYLAFALSEAKLNQYASQSGQPLISGARIAAVKLLVPPLPLQQTFATRIASIEALKTTHRRALAALDALFASLQQRAFAGQL